MSARQLVLGSEGDMDAGVTVLGMTGALAHSMFASSAATSLFGEVICIVGIILVSFIWLGLMGGRWIEDGGIDYASELLPAVPKTKRLWTKG